MSDQAMIDRLSTEIDNLAGERDDLRTQLETANDLIGDLRTELAANQEQNLTEQTWLRMELKKVEGNRDFFIEEAVKWSKMYAEYRQYAEQEIMSLRSSLAQWVRWGLTLRSISLPLWAWSIIITFGAAGLWLGWLPTLADR